MAVDHRCARICHRDRCRVVGSRAHAFATGARWQWSAQVRTHLPLEPGGHSVDYKPEHRSAELAARSTGFRKVSRRKPLAVLWARSEDTAKVRRSSIGKSRRGSNRIPDGNIRASTAWPFLYGGCDHLHTRREPLANASATRSMLAVALTVAPNGACVGPRGAGIGIGGRQLDGLAAKLLDRFVRSVFASLRRRARARYGGSRYEEDGVGDGP
jgi:hypothetical protein